MIDIKTKSAITVSIAVILTFSNSAFAINSDNISLVYDEMLITHTQLPLELKSIPHEDSFRVVAICALGDNSCGSDVGFSGGGKNINTSTKKCLDDGYLLNQICTSPKTVGAKCPYNPSYTKACTCPGTIPLEANEICTKSCDNKCIEKSTCPSGSVLNATKDKCLDNTLPDGSSFTSCNSCQVQTSTGLTESGNRYYSCQTKTCGDSGYNSGVPSNNKCTKVSYCGSTCYSNCYQPSCSENGYVDNIPQGNICTTISNFGRTCYSDCKVLCPSKYVIKGELVYECETDTSVGFVYNGEKYLIENGSMGGINYNSAYNACTEKDFKLPDLNMIYTILNLTGKIDDVYIESICKNPGVSCGYWSNESCGGLNQHSVLSYSRSKNCYSNTVSMNYSVCVKKLP